MSWVAVAVGVGTAVAGGVAQNKAAKKGANATTQATQASIDEQRRQFDLTRQDQMPWLDAGRGALSQLAALNGGDYSGFMNSPDYLWAREQGLQGLDRSAAARGSLFSGGTDADRMRFASGLATQNLGNYRGSLQSMAGLGQSTASGLGSMGMGMANNIGSLNMANGQARASSYMQQGQNNAETFAGIAGLFNRGYQANSAANGGGSGWYFGNNPGRG